MDKEIKASTYFKAKTQIIILVNNFLLVLIMMGGRIGFNPNTGHGGRQGSWGNNFSKSQCQLCGKFGHMIQICYHRLDINYHDPYNNQMSSMVASPSTFGDHTYHLYQTAKNIFNVQLYHGYDKVTVRSSKKLPILELRVFNFHHVYFLSKMSSMFLI